VGTNVYVPFGGLDGDCDTYYGWVVGVPINNPTIVMAWATTAFAQTGHQTPGALEALRPWSRASAGCVCALQRHCFDCRLTRTRFCVVDRPVEILG
jgi:hypothetical protein